MLLFILAEVSTKIPDSCQFGPGDQDPKHLNEKFPEITRGGLQSKTLLSLLEELRTAESITKYPF